MHKSLYICSMHASVSVCVCLGNIDGINDTTQHCCGNGASFARDIISFFQVLPIA